MIYQTSDGVALFYERLGEVNDPPLLLLHGLGADHQMWAPQLTTFPAAGRQVIVPDLRGHGRSRLHGAFSLGDCARDMSELLNELGVNSAAVIGVSMGGLIAQQMACDYPQQVRRLVIVDSFSGASTWLERSNAWLAAVLLRLLPASVLGWLLVTTYRRLGKAEVADYFAQQLAQADPAQVRAARAVVNQFDITARLPEIHVPTLVLVGDGFGKMALGMARRTADGISGAAFQVLPGGGDPSNLLVPQAFNQAVLDFV